MTKFALLGCLLAGIAGLACGVLHLVEQDESGEVVFAPRVDTTVLAWWVQRAATIAERAATPDEAAAIDRR